MWTTPNSSVCFGRVSARGFIYRIDPLIDRHFHYFVLLITNGGNSILLLLIRANFSIVHFHFLDVSAFCNFYGVHRVNVFFSQFGFFSFFALDFGFYFSKLFLLLLKLILLDQLWLIFKLLLMLLHFETFVFCSECINLLLMLFDIFELGQGFIFLPGSLD